MKVGQSGAREAREGKSRRGWLARFAESSGPVAILVFATFWLVGGPLPHFDDVVFTEPAVRFASGQGLANPSMRLWDQALESRYFAHGVFYPILLGAWLAITGVSKSALTAFQCASLALGAWAMASWLRHSGHSRSWVAVPLLLIFFGAQGMRQDILGISLFGLALACSAVKRRWAPALGGIFLTMAIVTWPVLVGYGLGLMIVPLILDGPVGIPRHQRVLAFGLGVVLALVLLGTAIQWRVGEYLNDYGHHVGLVTKGGPSLGGFIFELTNGWAELIYGPLYALLVLAVVGIGLKWQSLRLSERTLAAGIVAGLVANILLQTKPMHQVFDFFAGILLLVVFPELFGRRGRQVAVTLALAALAWSKSYDAMALVVQDHSRGDIAALRARVEANGREIWFDEIAARYVFGYRVPGDGIYWNFSRPFPQVWPLDLREKKPGSIWIVARSKADSCEGMERSERVVLWGHRFESLPLRPWELLVVE